MHFIILQSSGVYILNLLNVSGKIQTIHVFFFQTIYALQIISLEAVKAPHNSLRTSKAYSTSECLPAEHKAMSWW